MPKVKISVCLTTYNGEKFIKDQLLSILGQTVLPSEIIICDDGSHDHTLSIIDNIIEGYSGQVAFRIHRNSTPLGVIKNFEHAISLASGPYFALCDQDDIWESNKLEVQLETVVENERRFGESFPLLCVHDLAVILQDRKLSWPSVWNRLGDSPIIPNSHIFFTNKYYGCTMFFNGALRNIALPFPSNIPMHDHWLALNAYCCGKILTVKEALIRYRRHADNLTSLSEEPRWPERLRQYFKSSFGYDYKNREIAQDYEIYNRNRLLMPLKKRKELEKVIAVAKFNNLMRKLYFSIKYRSRS